jgi:hypothetical protein
MGSHHHAAYEALLRCHRDDLEALAQRRRVLAVARLARAWRLGGRTFPSEGVRCRLAGALVTLARRLDPEAGTLPRADGTASRA